MKSAVVPAEITSVEDKVAGNLGMTQFLLLSTAVLGGAAIYTLVPPFLGFTTFKGIVVAATVVGFSILSIRIKGQILVHLLIIMLSYNRRPRYHVNNKNDMYLRSQPKIEVEDEGAEQDDETQAVVAAPQLGLAGAAQLQQIIDNPQANLHFRTNRKGAMRVHVTETK